MKKKFQWQASLLQVYEGIEIWCDHLPGISSLLGQKKTSYPTDVHRVMRQLWTMPTNNELSLHEGFPK